MGVGLGRLHKVTEFRYMFIYEYVIVRAFTVNSRRGTIAFIASWVVRIL